MKNEKTPIELDKRRYIIYDMDALYELEKVYGSFQHFIEATENMQEKDVLNFLQAGLHEPLGQDLTDYYEKSDLLEKLQIKLKILQALTGCWPETDKEEKTNANLGKPKVEWNWFWYFYMATTLLNWSEEDFWRSTPRKLFGLWAVHRQYHGLDKEQPASQKSAQAQAFVDHYL